ncbi:MAG: hypothetical protein MI919_23440 [Holophagales bacterium]|nr:hypothetical protein [Holophagales bacterium]
MERSGEDGELGEAAGKGAPALSGSWTGTLASAAVSLAVWLPLLAAMAIRVSPESSARLLGPWRWPVVVVLVVGCGVGLLALRHVGGREGSGAGAPPAADPGLVLRLALFAAVACAGIYLWRFAAYDELSALIACGLAAVAFGGLVLAGRRRSAPLLARRLDLLLFNLCLLLVLAEGLLRGMARLSPSVIFERLDASVEEKIERTRLQPGQLRLGFRANEGGYYDGPFLPRVARRGPAVLSIADSFALAPVPHHYHFTTVAERQLPGVEVYNMGMSAIDPREYLYLLLHEGLRLEPEVVLVNLYMGNDFAGPLPGAREGQLLARLFDRRNLLLYQVPRRLRLLRAEPMQDDEPVRIDRDTSIGGELRTVEDLHRAFPWLEDPLLEAPHLSDARHFRLERRYALQMGRLSLLGYERRLDRTLLPMQEALGDIPLVAMLIPARHQVNDALWEEIQRGVAAPLARDHAQASVLHWLRNRKIPVLDLLPLFRAVPPLDDGDRHLYRKNDTHINRRGNEVAGRALADFLEPVIREAAGEND